MNLESEEASKCNADCLRGFLEKTLDRIHGVRITFWPFSAVLSAKSSVLIALALRMRAIVSPEGLVATAGELHRAGHPEFRGPKKVPMADLEDTAREQLECLKSWREQVLRALEAAPILGLVPRGQLHAWLAELGLLGVTKEFKEQVRQGLECWLRCDMEIFEEKMVRAGLPPQKKLSAAPRQWCQGRLVVQTVRLGHHRVISRCPNCR